MGSDFRSDIAKLRAAHEHLTRENVRLFALEQRGSSKERYLRAIVGPADLRRAAMGTTTTADEACVAPSTPRLGDPLMKVGVLE
jgi:hypothetical protein